MTQYIAIEQSTDMKCRLTKIRVFTSKRFALKWQNESPCRLTYSDPDAARNYHHTLRYVYVLPSGSGGLGAIKRAVIKREKETPYHHRGVYFGTTNDRIASAVMHVGTQLTGEPTTTEEP